MGPLKKALGSAGIYLGANLVNAGIPFLLIPVLTRVLSPADYSLVAIFTVSLAVFGAFTGLSLHGSVGARFFKLPPAEFSRFVSAGMGLVCLSTTVVIAIVVLAGSQLERVTGLSLPWILAAVVGSSLLAMSNVRLAVWQVSGNAARFATFQICQSLLNAGMTLVFVFLLALKWEGRIAGQLLAIGVFAAIAVLLLWREGLVVRIESFRQHSVAVLRFGLPLVPHVIGAMLIAGGGQVLVANTLGPTEAGLYVIAMQFGAAFGVCAEAFGRAYQPWLFSRLQDGGEKSELLIVGVSCSVFGGFLVVAGIGAVVAYVMFPLIVGSQFEAARPLLFSFFAGAGFQGMYLAISGIFFYFEKTKYLAMVTVGSGVACLFAMWALGSRFGLAGFAVAFAFSQLLTFVFALLVARRIRPLPWKRFVEGIRLVWRSKPISVVPDGE
jgi:O-antigen/teichoic acid export membrane protein